ncbi:uncharacterized protein PHACADRAFT_211221 [Phanerochaete carnosa HHB-10118-sp]|uniref:DUF6534 domain-containing protein n=1 Tax=Phanerochaete carnosa (strain HHB-10118-sp) TaxID=650164 RepID=K5VPY5_PHACS|nr:uncharacterized protein PHACADRAFT_211221 [Phanerochaete carnosa HHB-10118-sp]EKM53533.1 hypothetical protein PHACADRAFT_211221 [Phanerochaete carnosa HHB-10118-sp]
MGELDLTLGTLLVGIMFNTFLFGLVMFQFIAYYRGKFNDPLPVKLMVLFLFLLDSVHSIACIWMAYYYCVTGYGQPETLGVAIWPYTLTPIATGWASMVTQIFLGWRVYRFTENMYLYGLIIALAIPSCALGMTCGIKAWIIKEAAKLSVLTNLVTAWLVLQVGVDALVTITLGIILARSKTGFQKTDTVVNRLIRGAIQTGLFAGIFSIGDLITFTRWPNTNFYGMFAIPIGRVYTNTLLDTLVSRNELRAQLHGTVDMDSARQAPSLLKWGRRNAPSSSISTTQAASTNIQLSEISVQKEVVVFGDESLSEAADAKPRISC